MPSPTLHPDQILLTLPKGVWFTAVGEPLDDGELTECANYLRGLGMPDTEIARVASWIEAREVADAPNWSRTWWEQERSEERRLFELAAAKYSADAVLARLTALMEGGAELFHGPASIACTRAGIADARLARSAAGAAAHALHQHGLASIAAQDEEHPFASKFRLFLAGRWPLCINEISAHAYRFHIY